MFNCSSVSIRRICGCSMSRQQQVPWKPQSHQPVESQAGTLYTEEAADFRQEERIRRRQRRDQGRRRPNRASPTQPSADGGDEAQRCHARGEEAREPPHGELGAVGERDETHELVHHPERRLRRRPPRRGNVRLAQRVLPSSP